MATPLVGVDALQQPGLRTSTPESTAADPTSPKSPSSATGTKRKRSGDPKFYSVRVGHQPGIYYNWSDCLAQVKGFKNATFKSFPSLADAESFLSGRDPSQDPSSSSFGTPKFYGVRNGLVPGVYTDWPSAQKQIIGCTKPKHRCFHTRAEAEAFVNGAQNTGIETSSESHGEEEPPRDLAHPEHGVGQGTTEITGPPAKQKKGGPGRNNTLDSQGKPEIGTSTSKAPPSLTFPPGTGPLPADAVDDFDHEVIMNPATGIVENKTDAQRKATIRQSTGLKDDSVLRIYTDGSSLGNGKKMATAGVGVYFGSGDERNVSEALVGPRQTNQRAELTAILRAIDIAPKHRHVSVYTDSRYSIDCVTTWYINWRKNSWKTAAGKAVENRDLIEDILRKVEERNAVPVETKFVWLKGHASDPGNIEADKLAVNGARNAKVME